MDDRLWLLPRYPDEAGDELPSPRPAWHRFYWPGFTLVFILGLDLMMWFAPPNLRWLFLLSGLAPWLALLLAGYGLGMAAIIEYAWRQSQPVNE
jgi:hypothetical protein